MYIYIYVFTYTYIYIYTCTERMKQSGKTPWLNILGPMYFWEPAVSQSERTVCNERFNLAQAAFVERCNLHTFGGLKYFMKQVCIEMEREVYIHI